MTATRSTPTPGEFARGVTVFGRRVVDRCVRRDRLASVFAAHDRERAQERFNVWSVRSDQITHAAGAAARFADAMGRVRVVDHSSLPEVIAWETTGDTPSVLTTARLGQTLREVITNEPFVGVDEVCRVVVEVADALAALHARGGIVHLGVCPERVTLGEDEHVTLEEGGFLFALLTAGYLSPAQVASLSLPGYVVPIELLTPPSPAADVFQLAVMAFEALTGQLPFGAVSPAELPAALRGSYLPSAAALRPGLATDVDAVFDRVWRHALGEGIDSPLAFSHDLVSVLSADRNGRPTFPSGVLPAVRLPIPPSEAPTRASHEIIPPPQRVSIVQTTAPQDTRADDNVDKAFDDTFGVDTSEKAPRPGVIEFTPAALRLDLAAQAIIDVTPVKPTLVGATGVRLPTHPPPPIGDAHRRAEHRPSVQDQPTPSMGYERVKLLAEQARADQEAIDLTADAVAEPTPAPPKVINVDATSKIEQELLEVLRRTTQGGTRSAVVPQGTSPRSASLRAGGRSARTQGGLPPPPGGTRASVPPPKTSRPPPPLPTAHDAHHDAHAGQIPPPPKLPTDSLGMLSEEDPIPSGRPRALHSVGPEVHVSPLPEIDGLPVAELSTQDILDAEPSTPGFPSVIASVISKSPSAVHTHDAPPPSQPRGSADRTEPTGTPIPPRPEVPPPAVVHLPPTEHGGARSETAPLPLVKSSIGEDPTTAMLPQVVADAKSQATASALITTVKTKGSTAAPTKGRSSTPGPEPRHSAPSIEFTRATQPPLVALPRGDSSWVIAARMLSISTFVAAVLVFAGYLYMRTAVDEAAIDALRDEVARLRAEQADASRASAPVVVEDAPPVEPDATVASASDASVAATDDVLAATTADVTVAVDVAAAPEAAVVATADASVAAPTGVPGEPVRVRLMGQMRAGIHDCVEGVEHPVVVVGLRFDGTSGSVTRVRLHGIFQEPPLGPCIEEVARRAHVAPFAAPFWETELRIAVPPPRWRPGGR